MAALIKPIICPYCQSGKTIRKGSRKNQYREVPRYMCTSCGRGFSLGGVAHVKFPPEIIVRALSLYNLGHSQQEVAARLSARFGLPVSTRSVSAWLTRYAKLLPFRRLRSTALKLYPPAQIVAAFKLEHRQVYMHKLHRAKLDLLAGSLARSQDYERLRRYLLSISEAGFPHRLFNRATEPDSAPPLRSSQAGRLFQRIPQRQTHNLANQLAAYGLLLALNNRQRHKQVQDFMLINDSATLACEVPVYLTAESVRYFKDNGFSVPIPEKDTPVTGHIDILQVRQGSIHILDYKPDAARVKPVSQLALYALALASHTRLPLKLFTCAWFDERDYFEFYPLRVVRAS